MHLLHTSYISLITMMLLLPSRLYCRFWILTKSCYTAHGLAPLGITVGREFLPASPYELIRKSHPALKNTIYLTLLFYS